MPCYKTFDACLSAIMRQAASSFVRMLFSREHQMMFLTVHAPRHHAQTTGASSMGDLFLGLYRS